ncbi:MAG: peptidylprolyl isomerase [Marinilabiliales bacterium]|nr:MAG: peptidylprolyl isomerase [Marinilabiliales bacterium]
MRSILLTLLIFLQIFSVRSQEVVDEVVAVVGSHIVMLSDIENQYYQYKQQGITFEGDLKCNILEELMYQKLLLNQAEYDSLEVTLKEVENVIDRKLGMFIDRIGDVEKLEEYFGKSLEEMKEELKEPTRDQLLAEKMQDKLTGELKVTPSEVRNYFKSIPADSLPLINAEMEFEQIVRYPKISETERLEVIDRLRGFRDRVMKGEKFATLAILYSEDPGTASKGGELGFLGRGDLVPEFSAVAFNLKAGEVSRVVETEFGFHIIQMIEKKGELINVRHILLKPKISEQEVIKTRKFLDSLIRIVRKDSLSFGVAASKYSEDEASKNNNGLAVNPYTGTSKHEVDQLDAATYYALKNLKIGDISKPFETVDIRGKLVCKVVRLKSRSKAHKANLNDDYQKIMDMAMEIKKDEVINKWIETKLKTTFVKIDPSYKNCEFSNKGWSR